MCRVALGVAAGRNKKAARFPSGLSQGGRIALSRRSGAGHTGISAVGASHHPADRALAKPSGGYWQILLKNP